MQVHDSRANKKSNSDGRSSCGPNFLLSSSDNNGNTSISNKNRQDNDDNSASVMSNLSSYSLIDDDHIDDQETINVGNLIIDLESDLEKEKIENEQANAKPATCATTAGAPSSTSIATVAPSSSFAAKASSSANSLSALPIPSGKVNQKSLGKHSNNNVTNNNGNLSNSSTINSSAGIGAGVGTSVGASVGIGVGVVSSGNISSNNNHIMTTRTVFKSSADERGELKMRITRETKPGKSEHKIVTSPNQKSPTSCSSSSSSSNINTTSHANNCEENILHESSSISSTKECGTSTSIGTITEPDCLGPCEPGTSVTLEGIVWQETEGGILVVNVTWRGKTYVGALLDCTKHDWAPPRLCDSPASDIDSKTHKGVRTKRIVTRSNGIGLDEKNLLQTTGKLRNGKGRRILASNEFTSCNKRQRELEKSNENIAAQAEANTSLANVSSITDSETASVPMNVDITPATNNESISTSSISTDKAGPNSPMLIGCSEPNCSKKYRNMNGLLYHQSHAHGTDSDSNNAQDNSCSSSVKEKQIKSSSPSKNEQVDQKETPMEASDRHASPPPLNELKQVPEPEVKLFQEQEKRRTPSPQLTLKMSNKIAPPEASAGGNALLNQESRALISKSLEPERQNSSSSNHSTSTNFDQERRSPGVLPRHLPPVQQQQQHHSQPQPLQHHHHHQHQQQQSHGHGPNNHSSSKSSSSSSKQSNPAPLPATTEEGMKPSGTSTGPPPAPHQANCYFNQAFLANTFNPYAMAPYLPRTPLPMYDPLAPPSSTANAAFLSSFMSNIRVPPPPESPSRLLSPSMPKNFPFPHFKVDPGAMPVPSPQMANPSLPSMSPLTNPPPLASGSPHLRMPSQVDPMLPPTSQPPFPRPVGLNPILGVPGSVNSMGPMGGPQVPSLVDDSLAKQFPRRFN